MYKRQDHIILPGVGAARDAVESLKRRELWETVVEQAKSGKPFLGICLGMQLLFERKMCIRDSLWDRLHSTGG